MPDENSQIEETPTEEVASPPDQSLAVDPSPPADDGGAAPVESTAPLVDGGGKDDDATTAPAHWPENWRDIMAGGDAKALAYLARYNSPANVSKALMAMRAKMDSGEMVRSKPDGEDETALNEWRAQAGIPNEPDGYLEKLPDGIVVGEDDQPIVDGFLAAMHDGDAPPSYVHTALQWYFQTQEDAVAAQAQQDSEARVTNEDELRAEWGPEYRANMNAAKSLVDIYGEEGLSDVLFGARAGDGSLFGDHPAVLRFLASMSRELNPHGTVTPSPGQTVRQTIDDEITTLEREMQDTKGRDSGGYWHSEAKQARYRELLEMRERAA